MSTGSAQLADYYMAVVFVKNLEMSYRCARKLYVNAFLFYLMDQSIHELGESKNHFLKDREDRPHKHP